MNFVFVSPQFPHVYWQFCVALRRDGARVLGIGDTPYDALAPELRDSLDEYYWVHDLEDYDEVYRAVAYFSFHYGKPDWIESNNEHWLPLDARLREDFNVARGPRPDTVARWQSKAAQKPLSPPPASPRRARPASPPLTRPAGSSARWATTPSSPSPRWASARAGRASSPLTPTCARFSPTTATCPTSSSSSSTGASAPGTPCWTAGGSRSLRNQEEFPPSMADVVYGGLDLAYRSCPTVDPELARLGRATVRAFGLTSRFVHLEFFRLDRDHPASAPPATTWASRSTCARPAGPRRR